MILVASGCKVNSCLAMSGLYCQMPLGGYGCPVMIASAIGPIKQMPRDVIRCAAMGNIGIGLGHPGSHRCP
jgi:hypothetical protein